MAIREQIRSMNAGSSKATAGLYLGTVKHNPGSVVALIYCYHSTPPNSTAYLHTGTRQCLLHIPIEFPVTRSRRHCHRAPTYLLTITISTSTMILQGSIARPWWQTDRFDCLSSTRITPTVDTPSLSRLMRKVLLSPRPRSRHIGTDVSRLKM